MLSLVFLFIINNYEKINFFFVRHDGDIADTNFCDVG